MVEIQTRYLLQMYELKNSTVLPIIQLTSFLEYGVEKASDVGVHDKVEWQLFQRQKRLSFAVREG